MHSCMTMRGSPGTAQVSTSLIIRGLDFTKTRERCISISIPDCEPKEWYSKLESNAKDTIKCQVENLGNRARQWSFWKLERPKERIFFNVITAPPQMLAIHPLYSVFLCSQVQTASLIFLVAGVIWKLHQCHVLTMTYMVQEGCLAANVLSLWWEGPFHSLHTVPFLCSVPHDLS